MIIKNLRSLSNFRKVILSKGISLESEQVKKIDEILKGYIHLFVITEEELQSLLNQFTESHKDFSTIVSHGPYGLGEKRIKISNKFKRYDFYIETYNDLHDMSYLLIQKSYRTSALEFINEYPEFEEMMWNYLEIKLRRDQEIIENLLSEKVLESEDITRAGLLRKLIESKMEENQKLKENQNLKENQTPKINKNKSKKIYNNSIEAADAYIELCLIDDPAEE